MVQFIERKIILLYMSKFNNPHIAITCYETLINNSVIIYLYLIVSTFLYRISISILKFDIVIFEVVASIRFYIREQYYLRGYHCARSYWFTECHEWLTGRLNSCSLSYCLERCDRSTVLTLTIDRNNVWKKKRQTGVIVIVRSL